MSPRLLLRWIGIQLQTPYHGNNSAQGFELTRTIRYRNSFLALTKVRLEALPQV